MGFNNTRTLDLRSSRLIIVVASLATVALALAVPLRSVSASSPAQQQPPHVFTGSASVDGTPAPEGTIVSALVNGVVVGSVKVDAAGNYPALLVETPGVTVTFTVGDIPAAETATAELGGASLLNLTANTRERQATTPNNAAATPVPTNTPFQPTPLPTPTAAPPPTAVPAVFESVQSAFRVGPTVRLRPVNDVIDKDTDGLVEILFRNPVLNEPTMVVDLTVSLPSGLHLYGEGFATDTAAGAASGSFEVPPGQSRTIFLNLKAEKTGRSIVHFSGAYWPKGNKDLFNPVSLTHPFVVNAPSPDPLSETPTNSIQMPNAPPPAPAAMPTQPEQGDPSVSCSLSPGPPAASNSGDLALLTLPLLALAGVIRLRR